MDQTSPAHVPCPAPRAPGTYLRWARHTNGIIARVTFCVRLPSRSPRRLGSVAAAACVRPPAFQWRTILRGYAGFCVCPRALTHTGTVARHRFKELLRHHVHVLGRGKETSPHLEAEKALQAPVRMGHTPSVYTPGEALAQWKIQCLPSLPGPDSGTASCPLPSCHQVHVRVALAWPCLAQATLSRFCGCCLRPRLSAPGNQPGIRDILPSLAPVPCTPPHVADKESLPISLSPVCSLLACRQDARAAPMSCPLGCSLLVNLPTALSPTSVPI